MLKEIIAATRARLEEAGTAVFPDPPAARPFGASLQQAGLQVIAEIKRRSPSAGVLAAGLDPVRRAREYELGGAAAISVLTEPDYFAGSLQDLVAVRQAVALPVLRKDFIIDPRQVTESRLAGADALLLIVAALERVALRRLLAECEAIGIEALVEAHDATEAQLAVDLGAKIVGINNRNLHTFETDLSVAEKIGPSLPHDRVLVAESGVSNPTGAARMRAAGYDAILVGEALVAAADPATVLRELRAAER